jgi:hypothetical protein
MENKENIENPNLAHIPPQYLLKEKDIPEGKVSFKIGYIMHPDGSLEKKVVINGEVMEYSIDYAAYLEAHRMGLGNEIKKDIAKHYLSCVSEMVGRNITMQEILQGEKKGFI